MSAKNPKISVVIPAYNENLFLPKLLASLKQQIFPHPYEIIVVDNNSSDNTAEVAKTYGANVIKEMQQGYARACNAGFYAAKGEIIARADADYIVPKDWLEKIWNAFQSDKELIAVGGPIYPLESYWWENYVSYPAIVIWMYVLKLLGRGFLFPNMATKKTAFVKTHGFNTTISFGEDQDMCLRLKELGKVDLDLNIYAHTSMRRAKDMGMFRLIVGYSFANQIALWRGKSVRFGTHPVRIVPKHRPVAPHKPWVYLIVTPLSLAVIIILVFFMFSKPAQQYVKTQIIPSISQQFSR